MNRVDAQSESRQIYSSELIDLVAALRDHSVLVLGDVMLDEYVWGEVRRISPEAPVPVVEARRRTYTPGGAANVAVNVAAFGGRVWLGSVIGRDQPGACLRQALLEHGVEVGGLIVSADRPTTTKTRIVAHNQQIARVDSEARHAVCNEIEDALMSWITTQMPNADACIISDYGKGLGSARLTQFLIRAAQQAGKPVIVDPKGTDYSKYRGATLVTPNVLEAERAANREVNGDDDLGPIAGQLRNVLDDSALLITRGAEGMSLFMNGDAPIHIPTVARQVFDVTGAGDTVIGTLALALAAGARMEMAVRLANIAAGIVVGKVGTAAVTPEELTRAVRDGSG
jgi:D-beta-D-heptose 7-phosphate kinase/D-beta-D-heptose 1-phosphate adenosyltransferase